MKKLYTAEEIVGAFEATGVLPTRGFTYRKYGDLICGCALTALAIQDGLTDYLDICYWGARHLYFQEALTSGFDYNPPDSIWITSEKYKSQYNEARKACEMLGIAPNHSCIV